MDDGDRLAALATERHISLTTFRRDGTAASTPVWVVSDDGRRLLVWTGADTWKAKRIRRNSRVRVAPSDARGNARGEAVEGSARLLGPEAAELVQGLLRRKYGLLKRGLDAFNGLTRMLALRPEPRAEYVEIVPARD